MKKFWLLAIAGLVMVSCDYDKDASNHKLDANQINYIVDAKTFSEMETKRLTEEGIIGDPLDFTINNVERSGNILKFDVSYGGGCQNHYFDVIWDTVVLEIHPCKTALLISHRKDDNDFGCNKVEVETLEIDLERLFVDDNAEALNCTIDIFKMTNKTTDPDIVVSAPEK